MKALLEKIKSITDNKHKFHSLKERCDYERELEIKKDTILSYKFLILH
jgi:hypothetical protein